MFFPRKKYTLFRIIRSGKRFSPWKIAFFFLSPFLFLIILKCDKSHRVPEFWQMIVLNTISLLSFGRLFHFFIVRPVLYRAFMCYWHFFFVIFSFVRRKTTKEVATLLYNYNCKDVILHVKFMLIFWCVCTYYTSVQTCR